MMMRTRATGITAVAAAEAGCAKRSRPRSSRCWTKAPPHGPRGSDGTGYGTHFRVRIASPLFAGKPRWRGIGLCMMPCAITSTAACIHALAIEDALIPIPSLEGLPMKQFLLTALAAATLGIALPAAAQNIAIVNGKPVPKARMEMLRSSWPRPAAR
jgi:hypothetical protein